MAIFISLFRLVSWELLFGAACGVAFGVVLATWYRINRQRKDERRQLVRCLCCGPLPLHQRQVPPLLRPAVPVFQRQGCAGGGALRTSRARPSFPLAP